MPISSPFLWSMFLQVALLPFAVTLAILLFGRRLERDALAVAAGFLAAYFVVYSQFSFPPLQALDWLPMLLLAVLVIASFRDILPLQSIRAEPAILAFAVLVVLLWPLLHRGGEGFYLEASMAVVVWWGVWRYLDREFHDTMVVAIAIVAVAVGNAVIAVETGSILTGQLCGVLAASVAGWLLWQVWRSHPIPAHGVIAVAVLILGSLMAVGHFYADTAAIPALVSLAGFVAVPFSRSLDQWRNRYAALFVVGVVALLPVAISIFLVLRSSAEAAGAY